MIKGRVWCKVHEDVHDVRASATCGLTDWKRLMTAGPVVADPEFEKTVIRVLVYEGTERWIDESLSPDRRSFIQKDRPYECMYGRIHEHARVTLEVPL